VVEGQHVISTRKLVASDAEQLLLEELLERAKPPLPPEPEFEGLHYLLSTPFRYPPLPHGSRFGTRAERGIWYGAESLPTALAEVAYYRLLFLEGTEAELGPVFVDMSAFTVGVESDRAVDFAAPAFAADRDEISSPVAYDASQRLGREMRADGVAAFRYRSARDSEGGFNLGLFTPRAFASRRPSPPETWHCTTARDGVELTKRDFFRHLSMSFPRQQFLVDGRLPAPAI
jgi:hypothetical protein